MKRAKTNAARLLDGLCIAYTVREYDTRDGAIDGLSVAIKTGREPEQVYKTLVAHGAGGGLVVFCIPVNRELDLKQAARAAGEKSLAMLPQAQLLAATGYVHGGVSPLGMKKPCPVFIWAGARAWPQILVSAGRVGLQLELAPEDLARAVNAAWFDGETAHVGE